MANVNDKFHGKPSSHSQVITCVQTGITGHGFHQGRQRDRNAQRIMGNGVIIIPSHEFEHPPR
jgi:hypothetical protein